jgi:hypothetical protein
MATAKVRGDSLQRRSEAMVLATLVTITAVSGIMLQAFAI